MFEEREQKGLLAEAEQAARRVVALADFAQAWNNLGIVLRRCSGWTKVGSASNEPQERNLGNKLSSASEMRRKPDDRSWRTPTAALPSAF